MVRLKKRELLDLVERAIRDSGWHLLFRDSPDTHPARISVVAPDGRPLRLLVYIWNITHGGGLARAKDEWRIQVTGVDKFIEHSGERTLILGWWSEGGVFAGWDYRRHNGALGRSPSMQIGEASLTRASREDFASYRKQTGEIAIAFKPSFLTSYAEHAYALHDAGNVPGEAEILDRISPLTDEPVSEDEVRQAVPAAREFAIIAVRRALRDISFRDRVLTAYGHHCAMCGLQLDLIDAAHILPVSVSGSTDETCNGIALCALHHRAYDSALVTFGGDYATVINKGRTRELRTRKRDAGLDGFAKNLRPVLNLPPAPNDRPKRLFVDAANKARGWP